MLLLKGERRKSVVCDTILNGNKNAVCYQYTRDVVPTLNSYIVSSDNPQELLGEKLLNEVQLSNPNMLVIYTNEKQADLAVLQEWIDKIENSSGCLVILACR